MNLGPSPTDPAPGSTPPPGVSEQERLSRAALSRLAEPGDPRLGDLVVELGAERLRALLSSERGLDGLASDVSARLAACDPARELDQAQRLGIRFVVPGDPEWPTQLDDLSWAPVLHERGGPPVGLWVKGPVRLDSLGRSVAIVGSRSATSYGTSVASDLGAAAGRAGLCVISGAAFGIDQAAHRGAIIGGGPTVAVLACGADRVYPQAHRTLIDHLAREGAVVSEAAPGGSPTRVRFLARNRLIAALTRATVVVEAALRSGALNTASWAGGLHRTVLGVPGPVTSASSEGVHRLLRSRAADLVCSGAELVEILAASGEHLVEEPRGPTGARDRLSVRQRQVLDAVPVATGASTESVARVAGLGLLEVRSGLSRLVHAGLVERDHDGWRLSVDAMTTGT